MGSVEAAACALVSGHVEAPRTGDAQEGNASASCANITALLPHFDAGSTFPFLKFLSEPAKGSWRHHHQAEEPKWDIRADRDLLLGDELKPIGSGLADAESHTESSLASGLPPDSCVREMQLKKKHHPAWFRLQASAANPSSWDEFVQRMTGLSDSSTLSKFMNELNSDGGSGAGLCKSALFSQDSASDGDGRPLLQPTSKRQRVAGACGPGGVTTACTDASSSMDGVNWGEELMYLDQEEAGEGWGAEERSVLDCELSELQHQHQHQYQNQLQHQHQHQNQLHHHNHHHQHHHSHAQEQDEAHDVDAFPHIAALCDSPDLTKEQQAIVNLADPSAEQPPCVRVIAAAGTGKTLTLVHIVRRLQAEAPKKKILYLVYNKSFQLQAQAKLGTAVTCLTLDACSGQFGFPEAVMPRQRMEDTALASKARDMLRLEIDRMPWMEDSKREADTPTADTQKGMMVKWVLRTLDLWMQRNLNIAQIVEEARLDGKVALSGRSTDSRCFVHWPCLLECTEQNDSWTGTRSNRLPSLSRDCSKGRSVGWYMDKACDVWKAMEGGTFAPDGHRGPCGTHAFWMKKAQLEGREMPFDVILLDEAQDVTECQLTWTIQRQKHAMRFCVGDPCQRIYGFRGALVESEFDWIMRRELTSKPMLLSHSFRFGSDIARVANSMLFVRFNLKPTKKDDIDSKYQVHGMPSLPCVALHSRSDEAAQLLRKPHTLIAHTNLALFKEVVELLEAEPQTTFHINGENTRQKFKACLKEINDAFPLYKATAGEGANIECIASCMQSVCASLTMRIGCTTASQPLTKAACGGGGRLQYKKFFSWTALKRFAELQQHDSEKDDEASLLVITVSIIEMYREQTLYKCGIFNRAMQAECRADEAKVTVTTTHQAKGMEFDIVRLCDDFGELNVFEKNEAKFRASADDMNLWYVAVTRARRAVILPPKFMDLALKICETLDECTSTTGADSTTSNAASLRARAKLFHNWPLPLLLQPADVPLSPTRARLLVDARTL